MHTVTIKKISELYGKTSANYRIRFVVSLAQTEIVNVATRDDAARAALNVTATLKAVGIQYELVDLTKEGK